MTYSITRNLTNCASSNTANTIAEGAAYTTVLSPTGTFKKLGAITVTMGGTNISASTVSGSTITIPKVTGNIVITCAAEITNIINTVGISTDTRLSTSSGTNKARVGWATIGANMDAASLIHLAAGDVLRIKGVGIPAASDGSSAIVKYNADGTFYSATYLYNGVHFNGMLCSDEGNGLIKIVNRESENDIRVSVICTDTTAVVVTINEPIT